MANGRKWAVFWRTMSKHTRKCSGALTATHAKCLTVSPRTNRFRLRHLENVLLVGTAQVRISVEFRGQISRIRTPTVSTRSTFRIPAMRVMPHKLLLYAHGRRAAFQRVPITFGPGKRRNPFNWALTWLRDFVDRWTCVVRRARPCFVRSSGETSDDEEKKKMLISFYYFSTRGEINTPLITTSVRNIAAIGRYSCIHARAIESCTRFRIFVYELIATNRSKVYKYHVIRTAE